MTVAMTIEQKLREQLAPERIEVVDESHKHAGHAGARPEGQTHFDVMIVAETFAGMNRVARQRKVYEILAEEMAGPVHALALRTLAPGEI